MRFDSDDGVKFDKNPVFLDDDGEDEVEKNDVFDPGVITVRCSFGFFWDDDPDVIGFVSVNVEF
jgi:hypothetical protein